MTLDDSFCFALSFQMCFQDKEGYVRNINYWKTTRRDTWILYRSLSLTGVAHSVPLLLL